MDKVSVRGQTFDLDAVVNLMDDELRERLHDQEDWPSEQAFVDAYVAAHAEKFGVQFSVE